MITPDEELVALLPRIERLAAEVARRCPPSIELEDLVQVGAQACWQALPRFDRGRGVTLWSWLCLRCHGAMIDHLREHGFMLSGTRRGGRRSEYRHSLQEQHSDGSLRFEVHDRAAAALARERNGREGFHDLLRGCTQTERIILTLRFQANQKLHVIGKSLGLSESRVSQMLAAVLARLKAKTAGCDAGPEVAARSAPGGSQPDRLPTRKRCPAGGLVSL